MTSDAFLALALFAFVSSATPGPNNMMLLASGANFGFRRTIPHMLGISVGFMVLMAGAGIGLAQIFERFPVVYTVFLIASVMYLLYLAGKIANAAPVEAQQMGGEPMTFLQAAAFQWVNPKAWTMALNAITVHVGDGGTLVLALAALVFAGVNLPSVSMWNVLGQQMARILTNPARLRLFNWTMAALLVGSLYPVLGYIQ